MALYSLQGALPAPLPSRIRLPNGLTRTNPSTYSSEEISSWGFIGPITIPFWNPSIEAIKWSPKDLTYAVRVLSEKEIEERLLVEARQQVDYQGFYDMLLPSAAYRAIREQAEHSLPITVACTEFIAAITDAKFGRPNELVIQACIDSIFSSVVFSEGQTDELMQLFAEFKLNGLYSILRS